MKKKKIRMIIIFVIFIVVALFVSWILTKNFQKRDVFVVKEKNYTLWLYGKEGELKLPNLKYNVDSDINWKYISNFAGASYLAEANGNYYVRLGEYVYLCDFGKEELVPLCNKTGCIHDQEVVGSKKKECNAYVPEGWIGSGIQYYQGKLYANSGIRTDTGEYEGEYLYRLSLDGSESEILEGQYEGAESLLIHRGNVYYINCRKDDLTNQNISEIHISDLQGTESKVIARLISEAGTDFDILPYGDCLYISLYSDRNVNYLILYNMRNCVFKILHVDKGGVIYPDKDFLWIFTYGKLLQTMKADGTNIKDYGVLEDPLSGDWSLQESLERRSWYLSLDEKYIYQLFDSGGISYLGIYDRMTMKIVNCIVLEKNLFCYSTVGFDDERIFFTDNFINQYAVYWMQKDELTDRNAKIHILHPQYKTVKE